MRVNRGRAVRHGRTRCAMPPRRRPDLRRLWPRSACRRMRLRPRSRGCTSSARTIFGQLLLPSVRPTSLRGSGRWQSRLVSTWTARRHLSRASWCGTRCASRITRKRSSPSCSGGLTRGENCMSSVIMTGNRVHDQNCLNSLITLQGALPGAGNSQSAVNQLYITHYRNCRASAIAGQLRSRAIRHRAARAGRRRGVVRRRRYAALRLAHT